jgi:hypothetical protein
MHAPLKRSQVMVFRLDLSKRKLATLPAAERRLLLLLGHASNEINVLRKLTIMSHQAKLKNKSVAYVQTWQTLFLMRLLIAKIHEAWDLFEKRFRDDRVASKYLPLLGITGTAALHFLRDHFGKGSPLTRIRNKFTFQYGDKDDLIDASFNRLPDDESMLYYLSASANNSYHGASEFVIAKGIMELAKSAPTGRGSGAGTSEEEQAFESLYRLTLRVSDQIITLFGQCIGSIFVESLGKDAKVTPIDLGHFQKYLEIDIPFFVDESE